MPAHLQSLARKKRSAKVKKCEIFIVLPNGRTLSRAGEPENFTDFFFPFFVCECVCNDLVRRVRPGSQLITVSEAKYSVSIVWLVRMKWFEIEFLNLVKAGCSTSHTRVDGSVR